MALLTNFLGVYAESEINLSITYGQQVPYSISDVTGFDLVNNKVEYFSESFHSYRLSKVYLKVSKSDNITQLAKYLSDGQFDSPREIEDKILEYLQKFSRREVVHIPLENLAPKFVKINNNKYGKQRVQNCFAASILWHFFDYKIQYNTNFKKFLKSHMQPVLPGTALKFGDIIVFRDNMGQLVHSAIYITDELLWHKQGQIPCYHGLLNLF